MFPVFSQRQGDRKGTRNDFVMALGLFLVNQGILPVFNSFRLSDS
jgi:hypothetical protein